MSRDYFIDLVVAINLNQTDNINQIFMDAKLNYQTKGKSFPVELERRVFSTLLDEATKSFIDGEFVNASKILAIVYSNFPRSYLDEIVDEFAATIYFGAKDETVIDSKITDIYFTSRINSYVSYLEKNKFNFAHNILDHLQIETGKDIVKYRRRIYITQMLKNITWALNYMKVGDYKAAEHCMQEIESVSLDAEQFSFRLKPIELEILREKLSKTVSQQ